MSSEIDRLGFTDALDQKRGPFGWIFQQDGTLCHTSQVALDWLEESVNPIVDWPANSPGLSPIELPWAILERFAMKSKPKTIKELRNTLIAAWSLIPQSTIDKLCEGFKRRLGLCLANGELSISNQLWHLSENHGTKHVFKVSQVYVPWTDAEDSQLIQDWLTIGPRRKSLEKTWMKRSASQLKNHWHHELRRRLHEIGTDNEMLTKALTIPVLTKA
jgi:hypothetical protein